LLYRCKAYNAAELLAIVLVRFEEYYQNKMLDVAMLKIKALHNPATHDTKIKKGMINKETENMYFVNSGTADESYLVDTVSKMCSCIFGRSGKLCKHILAVEHHYPKAVSISRIATAEERYKLAILAVGAERAPSREFFGVQYGTPYAEQPSLPELLISTPNSSDTSLSGIKPDNIAIEALKSKILLQLGNLISKHSSDENVFSGMETFSKTLQKLNNTNSNAFGTSLHLFGKEAVGTSVRKRSRKIKVQPTGIARRKELQPKSRASLSRGRPRYTYKNSQNTSIAQKIRHNLLNSILKDRPNAKKH